MYCIFVFWCFASMLYISYACSIYACSAHRGQEWALELELEMLWAIMWMLGIKPKSSGRTAGSLNCQASLRLLHILVFESSILSCCPEVFSSCSQMIFKIFSLSCTYCHHKQLCLCLGLQSIVVYLCFVSLFLCPLLFDLFVITVQDL